MDARIRREYNKARVKVYAAALVPTVIISAIVWLAYFFLWIMSGQQVARHQLYGAIVIFLIVYAVFVLLSNRKITKIRRKIESSESKRNAST